MSLEILFLTPQLPFPPQQGSALRNWGLIQNLAARHAVSVLSFAAENQQNVAEPLRVACRTVTTVPEPRRSQGARLRSLAGGASDLAKRLWCDAYARALRDRLHERRFDVVQIEGLEMAPYLATIRSAAPSAAVVYDAHNAEGVIQRRALATDRRRIERWPAALYSWLQIPRLEQFEASVCRQADAVVVVSSNDARALATSAPGVALTVVTNGIDLARYEAAPAGSHAGLVFTGKMDYRPNIDAALWFSDEILPRIRRTCPEARLVVVGQNPPYALRRRHGTGGVSIIGAVDDVRPYISQAVIYVAPLRMGGGTRFKLLEAMAMSRPIVSTTLGAEGYPVQSGRELLLADSAAEFADAVLGLLAQRARAKELGAAGRAFVCAGYAWESVVPALEALYTRLVATPRQTRAMAEPR